MSFPPWDPIPPNTPLRDLAGSSLLVHTETPRAAVLIRCSPGLDEDRIQVVHARAPRANALKMEDADADTVIGEQAAMLVPGRPFQMVALPNITWKHPAGGRRWRTPVATLSAVVTAVALLAMRPTPGALVAVTVAVAAGCLVWLLTRRWVPTHIGPLGAEHSRGIDAIEYAMRRAGRQSVAPDFPPAAHNHSPTRAATSPDIQ